MRVRAVLIATVAIAVALPAIAQQVAQQQPAPAPAPSNVASSPEPGAAEEGGTSVVSPGDESAVEEVSNLNLPPPPPPTEYPGWARRDPSVVGALDPEQLGLGANPWGTASGVFLSVLMRRMDLPLASRWAHIALRDSLLARAQAPAQVNPVDWVAERAWLLLRMGEADAAKMLISSVDTDRFTPKMVQVAVQGALATGDPAGLCPIQDPIGKYDPNIRPLVRAMCSALAGEPETASAQIDEARRRGRIGGVDLALAQKVVGAAGSGQAATIEWEPVDSLTAWR